MMLIDSQQRIQATDPCGSYIVQAPAGSGKTELLTQRFLRLLAKVNSPEQIVALTFTRKAASEMRERILHALAKAAAGKTPQSDHQRLTYQYATEALAQSRRLGWQLLQQPGRLKIITIDSLCNSLTQSIPICERQVPYAGLSDQPLPLYMQAARSCLEDALEQAVLQEPLSQLLNHLDNDQEKLLTLFCDLLAKREQWLTVIYTARAQSRELYEYGLELIEQHELERFIHSVPDDLQDELCRLCRQLASIDANPDSPRRALRDWNDFTGLDRDVAFCLGQLLLTKTNSLRKEFDHHIGLKKGVCDDALYQMLRKNSKALFEQLKDNSDFCAALNRISKLPYPQYENGQWQILQALFTLLPLLAAHLHIVFREANQVDFSAIAQQALLSLGDDDQPTDLALYLDNTIHHLLVDEFQDTSIQQFQLLTRLVSGWQSEDGRTLFIVGDPMQSIYRFRQAEVGLFLKAWKSGIGNVSLTPLELRCNFRSTATIIDWVNQQFQLIFPAQNDIESGAISFSSAVSVLPATEDSNIFAYACASRQQEAEKLVAIVEKELTISTDSSIAVLVRSRSLLADIIPLLRARQIPFQGVEIEKLSTLPHIKDVWFITRSLLLPADRLSWLCLLRSPWCGLSLADLHCIANYNRHKSILYALANLTEITGLSSDGRLRAEFIYSVMQNALAIRHQQCLADWVRNTLKQLYLDHILTIEEQNDLEQFWTLLTRHNQDGIITDLKRFEAELDQLYSQQITPSRLQIMTIHKSKGLEFDCVILPGLGKKPNNNDKPLLKWLKLPLQEQDELLLISPVRASYNEQCLLYDYISDLDKNKENYELQRLLYVAATRAKKRLYLLDNQHKTTSNTFRELLQHQPFEQEQVNEQEEKALALPVLKRLPVSFYHNTIATTAIPFSRMEPVNFTNKQRLTGIIAHELLQWICNNHPDDLSMLPWTMVSNRFRHAGFSDDEVKQTIALLHDQITLLCNDATGQWICRQHDQERNEYELLIRNDGHATVRIIDRTFIDQGKRWIIDFKTGREDDSATLAHQQQVNGYAQLFANGEHPVHCGVYYLSTCSWVTWEYGA
ncbi:UvrD-helicase domain-containing protein [Legionella dresdenensis]|uniref:DNA 3'-5' helicase n=1 Tax=Legionella dresdenensis TaxID=450200 RepID=A0ABV8CI21_9GAMM